GEPQEGRPMKKMHRGLLLFLTLPAVAIGGTAARRAAGAEPPASTLAGYRIEDPGVESSRQMIQSLDRIVQARFSADVNRFGLDRIRTIDGHGNLAVLKPHDSAETAAMAGVNAAGRNYLIAFLHCAHIPGAPQRAQSGKRPPELSPLLIKDPRTDLGRLDRADGPYRELERRTEKRAIHDLPALRRGQALQARDGRWLIAMRPVKASSRSCLSCHAGAKLGDTLGVMVYGVDTRPEGPRQQVQQ
ncbi:MAG: hypothetical protein LC772_13420, partial [Chloroflexi bacterium]|nr:hypothetical protein [Chloroflexota bacterium]